MRIIKSIAFLVLVMGASTLSAGEINWNNKKIPWHNYDAGLEELANKNHVGIIILYADWCSTCKAYSKIFKRKDVVAALSGVTMIKANVDVESKIKMLKEYDQKYVPKTIVIDKNGNIVDGIFGEKADYMFFIPSDDPATFLQLVEIVKELNQGV